MKWKLLYRTVLYKGLSLKLWSPASSLQDSPKGHCSVTPTRAELARLDLDALKLIWKQIGIEKDTCTDSTHHHTKLRGLHDCVEDILGHVADVVNVQRPF